MKLNLLPTTVSKERKARSAWFGFAAMAIIGVAGAVFMTITSSKALEEARDAATVARPPADKVSAVAASADEIIKKSQGVLRNANLARAMIKHNDVYPNLFDDVKKYIPPFYRINSISATPIDDKSSSVTLIGTIQTFQQYSDLALALMKNPQVVAVTRSGFVSNDPYRPGLIESDQMGKVHKPTDGAIPDDQLERLAYFQSTVKPDGYAGVGNFGLDSTQPRGAMPDASLVTVQLVIARDIRTPNPRATVAQAGSTATTTTASAPLSGPTAPAAGAAPGGPAKAVDEDDSSAAKGKKPAKGSGD